MDADSCLPNWPSEVISFVSKNLVFFGPDEGWDHMHASAYEMGCNALTALGYADPTERGAMARASPQLPSVLPRWDDIFVAVLALAQQQNRISYRLPDGGIASPKKYWVLIDPVPAVPEPNIAGSNGLGPAYADAETLPVLMALELVAGSQWTPEAETVLWRERPIERNLEFEGDPRFTGAVEQALLSVPDDIAAEIDRLATITDADVKAAMARSAAFHDEMQARYGGTKAILRPPNTPEQARRSVEGGRVHELDWVFFRRWRLSNGWLTLEEAKRALGIFHDPLGMKMRQAVMARLYPHLPFLADRP